VTIKWNLGYNEVEDNSAGTEIQTRLPE